MAFIFPGVANLLEYGVRGLNAAANPTMFNVDGGASYDSSDGEFSSNSSSDVIIDGRRQNGPLILHKDFHVRSLRMVSSAVIEANGHRIYSQRPIVLDHSTIRCDALQGHGGVDGEPSAGLGGAGGGNTSLPVINSCPSLHAGFAGGDGANLIGTLAGTVGKGAIYGAPGYLFADNLGYSCAVLPGTANQKHGGAGKNGTDSNGGPGGAAYFPSQTGDDYRTPQFAQNGLVTVPEDSNDAGLSVLVCPWGGAGGGGGGSDAPDIKGGGGGGGGGIVFIATPLLTLQNLSLISANGAKGGNGGPGGGKGGGGGQGGAIIIHCGYVVLDSGSTLTVTGGLGGSSSLGDGGVLGDYGTIHILSEINGIWSLNGALGGVAYQLPPP